MLKSSVIRITLPEANLIDTIQFVKYGELYGVEIPDESNLLMPFERALSQAMIDLINQIRNGGQYIDVLTIHNGQPTCAEYDFKLNGFRCRKKVRFPTG